jgi:hypothetical protein
MVLRAKTHLAKALSDGQNQAAQQYISKLLLPYLDAAKQHAAHPAIQLDYDCPTAALKDYAALLKSLRTVLPEVILSITALPDWLNSRDFSEVIANIDYYVLQVHSLERPTTLDATYVLCDPNKTQTAVRRASKYGRPFYVALPTYTYRLVFDDTGHFRSIAAEQSSESPPPGWHTRNVAADPEKIAKLIRDWHAHPPRYCSGFVWFRLPVDSDHFNLSWPAFQKVMIGDAPKFAVIAEMRQPDPGLYEVWLSNSGEYTPAQEIICSVNWKEGSVLAHDVIGGYAEKAELEKNRILIHGPAPALSAKPTMAAWFRVRSEFNENKEIVQCSPVSLLN